MRVVVIGAGVIGLATGYELLQRGHEVVIVDACHAGAGASSRNAGWIVPAQCGPVPAPGMLLQGLRWMLQRDSPLHIHPLPSPSLIRFLLTMARHCNTTSYMAGFRAHLRLAERTMELLDAYADDGMKLQMNEHALLQVFATKQKMARALTAASGVRDFGIEPQALDSQSVIEREPALRTGLAGGIVYRDQRHLLPMSLVSELARRCRELGGELLEHAPVMSARRSHRHVEAVVTPHRVLKGDAFVLAAGVQTARLARCFGVRLPVQAGKGYSHDFAPAPVVLRGPVKLMEAQVALTPFLNSLRVAGTMEFGRPDDKPDPVRAAAVAGAPGRYFAEWGTPPATGPVWTGLRPMTPDGLPVLGPLATLPNCHVATGHGMLGVTLAPATGAAVAEAVTTGSVPETLRPFSPRRYGA